MFTNQQRFGVEDGLPQSFISGITQDKDGFIWLGTLDGLSRYDGRQFKNFRYRADDSTGLSSNAIAYLLPQANNRISLLYEGYHNDEFDMRTFKVVHKNTPDLLRKIPGIIWSVISTSNTYNEKDWLFIAKDYKGIGWYNIATGKVHYANKANGLLQQDSIAALLQTPQGTIYLVSENGVQVSDTAKKAFRFIKFLTGIRSRGIHNEPLQYYGGSWVTALPGNKLAVTDYNQIVILDLHNKTVKSYDLSDPPRPGLTEMARLSQTDKDHQLYFEHGGRIFRLGKNGQLKLLWQNTIAPQLKTTSCFIDQSDVLWVSVNAQGLLKIDLRAMPFHSYSYQTNFFVDVLQQAGMPRSSFPSHWLSEKEAYFFRYAYDSKGNLYCCYNPIRLSGLFEWSSQKLRELPSLPGEKPVFTAIAIDAHDGVWAPLKASPGIICPLGRVFKMPNGEVRTANLTPDKVTGLGSWTAEQFVARFRAYKDPSNLPVLASDEVNTIMPWVMFAGMDTSDLRSIYAYLQTVKPIKNQVVHFVAMKEN